MLHLPGSCFEVDWPSLSDIVALNRASGKVAISPQTTAKELTKHLERTWLREIMFLRTFGNSELALPIGARPAIKSPDYKTAPD